MATTTTYSFNLPTVGGNTNAWGALLNDNWSAVDNLLDGTTPVNGIDIDGGSIDGTPIGATTPAAGEFTNLTSTGELEATGTIGADLLSTLVDYFFPVNTIISTSDNVNPGTRFTGTTWVAEAVDRFLVGAGSAYAGGATGGAATHTLSVSEMPSHGHGVTDPGHSHGGSYRRADIGGASYTGPGPAEAGAGSIPNAATGISIQANGGGSAHNNMPPYVARYFWRRTV